MKCDSPDISPKGEITNVHNSSNCPSCLKTKLFYKKIWLALQHKHATDNFKVCGIVTFLNACLEYDKINPLQNKPKLLDSIESLLEFILNNFIYTKNYSNSPVLSISARIHILKNKYKDCTIDGAESRKICKDITIKPTSKAKKSKKSRIKLKKDIFDELKKELKDNIPTKGSLKRKRRCLKKEQKKKRENYQPKEENYKAKEENCKAEKENYEDDLFEERPFYRLSGLDEIASTSSDDKDVPTPTWKFSLSPRGESPVPHYEDCYNVEDLCISRSNAKEYQQCRKKREKPEKRSKQKKLKCKPVAIKVKDPEANVCKPSCSYSVETFKEEDEYDSEEVPDEYYTDSE